MEKTIKKFQILVIFQFTVLAESCANVINLYILVNLWIYPQFCVNVKGWCKIKVDRGGVQGSLFAALIAMKQKSCSLSRAAAQPLFIYP